MSLPFYATSLAKTWDSNIVSMPRFPLPKGADVELFIEDLDDISSIGDDWCSTVELGGLGGVCYHEPGNTRP